MASLLTDIIIGTGRLNERRRAEAEAKAKEDLTFKRQMEMLQERASLAEQAEARAFENKVELVGIQNAALDARAESQRLAARQQADIQRAQELLLSAAKLSAAGGLGMQAANGLVQALRPLMALPHVKQAFGNMTAEEAVGDAAADPEGTQKAIEDSIKQTTQDFSTQEGLDAAENVNEFRERLVAADPDTEAAFEKLSTEDKAKIFDVDFGLGKESQGAMEAIDSSIREGLTGIGSIFGGEQAQAETGKEIQRQRKTDLQRIQVSPESALGKYYLSTGDTNAIQFGREFTPEPGPQLPAPAPQTQFSTAPVTTGAAGPLGGPAPVPTTNPFFGTAPAPNVPLNPPMAPVAGGIEGTQPIEQLDVNQHIVAPGG